MNTEHFREINVSICKCGCETLCETSQCEQCGWCHHCCDCTQPAPEAGELIRLDVDVYLPVSEYYFYLRSILRVI